MERSYFFVRHGHTVSEADTRGSHFAQRRPSPWEADSQPDRRLSSMGRAQAHAAARTLLEGGVERVVSSRLRRARETAGHLAACGLHHAHVWEALDEIDPRTFRSVRPGSWALVPPSWWCGARMALALRQQVRGVPSEHFRLEVVRHRIRDVLSRLDQLDERRVAVVGHGFWILLMALELGGPPRLRWVNHGSITRVDADGLGHYRVTAFARRCGPSTKSASPGRSRHRRPRARTPEAGSISSARRRK